MTSDVVALLLTAPDEETGRRIARALVEERLAACVNRLAGMHSTYRWKGEVCREPEHMLLIKTTGGRLEAVKQRVLALHPYELPELIVVETASGHAAYLDWVVASCATASGASAAP